MVPIIYFTSFKLYKNGHKVVAHNKNKELFQYIEQINTEKQFKYI